jgi:hypothetical protein
LADVSIYTRQLTSSSLEADPNLGALRPAIWRTLNNQLRPESVRVPFLVRLPLLRKLLGSDDDSVT